MKLSKQIIRQKMKLSKEIICRKMKLSKQIIQKKGRFRTFELWATFSYQIHTLSVFLYALLNSNPQATFTEENSHDYTIHSQSSQSYTIIGLSF